VAEVDGQAIGAKEQPVAPAHLAQGVGHVYERTHQRASACAPAKRAAGPSSSSILSSWLYLDSRSERDMEPGLIWPQLVDTARAAMVASSVSPERWENTQR